MVMKRPAWVRKQKYSKDFEVIKAKKYTNKDFRFDNGCYVLLRIYPKTGQIGVAICDYRHTILKEFKGEKAQDLYTSIFDYSQKNKKHWFTRLEHAAYLGKELKKAEACLEKGAEYVQE